MKKVFLDELPTSMGIGNNRGKAVISWGKSIGCEVPFIYHEVEGTLKIVDYNPKKQKVHIKYLDEDYEIATSQLITCGLGTILKKYHKNHIYKIGDREGWCFYNGKKNLQDNGHRNGEKNGKPVEVFKDGVKMGEFKSVSHLAKVSQDIFNVKFISSSISGVCTGRRKSHKGYVFKYKE